MRDAKLHKAMNDASGKGAREESRMTPRYTQALKVAAEAHEGQLRKGTVIPFITHPVAVAALVARHGGDEDQQIAGLLHDVLDDAGDFWISRVQEFGDRVLQIVRGCTDSVPKSLRPKPGWSEGKRRYLEHLVHASADLLLVAACDKLHHLQSIQLDLLESGAATLNRFRGGREGTLWYYESLVEIFTARHVRVAGAFRAEFLAMKKTLSALTPA